MKKIFLTINYGCDNRFELVSKTIKVSAPYFYKIIILNYGPDENKLLFSDLLNEFPNLTVDNLYLFYHMNITEDLLRYPRKYMNDGDWCITIDSDWRLPQYFLTNMQDEIENCEREGYNHIFSYQIGHQLQKEISENYSQDDIDKFIKGWKENPDTYGFPLLQKVDKNNLWADSFYGNHSYLLHVPYNKKTIPEMYHLHIRDFSEHGYCSSMIFQSWWYISHNVFDSDSQKYASNSWETNLLENFKIKHKCFTSNHLNHMIKNYEFLDRLRELFLSFKDSKVFTCQQMYHMAFKYNMKFLNINPNDTKCSGVCCTYK